MVTDEEIMTLYKLRESRLSPARKIARDVRDCYHGDIVLPLPELDANTRPMVANLVQLGIDQHARRIRSRMPVPMFLADGDTKAARERARDKRSIVANWHREERLPLKMMRLTRHWCAYTAAILTLTPSNYDRACWRVRDPLDALPADSEPDSAQVTDCIFESTRTMGWMRANYPQAALPDRARVPDEGRTSLIEYIDAEERVFLASWNDITGFNGTTPDMRTIRLGHALIELDLEFAPVAVGWRPGLARPSGQMDGVIGPYWAMAMLEALEMIAVKKSVFPNTWMIGQQGESPKIIREADGLRDIIGEASNATPWIDNVQPGFMAPQAIDRTERNIRVTAGVPSDFGGECVDEETEILTENGWKRYDEIEVGTTVLTLNHETGMSEWQPILKVNLFEATHRRLMEAKGRRHSSLTTFNHRWPVLDWSGRRVWKCSGTLTSHDQVPIAAMCADLPVEPKYSDALVEAVAWLYTEGHVRDRRGYLYQSIKNSENVERIRSCLRALFGEPTYGWRYLNGSGQGGVGHDGVPRWNETPPNKIGVIHFNLSGHALDVLIPHAPGKVPTFDFLRALTGSQLDLFLRVSMLADNCGTDRFGQGEASRSEAFAFAAILSGRAVSYRVRTRDERRPGWRARTYDSFIVRLRKRRYVKPIENVTEGASTYQPVDHEGIVWCPTTPNGTWYARRNGSVYFTGNSASNVRTGRRGDSILSSTIDFSIQEAQDVFAEMLHCANRIAIEYDRQWYPATKKFYVRLGDREIEKTYTPNVLWANDRHTVDYAFSGTDGAGLIIQLGQELGTEMLSHRSAMFISPHVDDPDSEHDQIQVEKLEAALLQGLLAQAQQGALPPSDLARIMKLVGEDVDLADAVAQAHQEAQARQAAQVPPTAPAAQPGIAQPGAGAESQPSIEPPTPGQRNISSLLSTIRRTQLQNTGPQ